ncbi:hypothetical protein BYT27DRAFT_7180657 [Phlegmacium glaucopus]|nr:hypothetical protein BYT27DRAFT_7180657 [Phlegmacium glaucopus]
MKEIREKEALEKETAKDQQKNRVKKVRSRTISAENLKPFDSGSTCLCARQIRKASGTLSCYIRKEPTVVDNLETIAIDKATARGTL